MLIHRGKSVDMLGRVSPPVVFFSLRPRQKRADPVAALRKSACLLTVTAPGCWVWGRLIAPEALYCRCEVAACFIGADVEVCAAGR